MAQNTTSEAMAKAMAAIEAANQARAAVIAAPALDAQKKALEAVQAAKAAEAANAATAQIQAALEKAQNAARWKVKEETIEEALEHAGISGVDAQIDENGFAKLVGTVGSDLDRDTAIAMVEHFQVTGLESQLQVVPPPPPEPHETPAPAAGAAPAKYKVKAGDSWWAIAQRAYGDGTLWKALKAANNNPKMIHPGNEVLIPAKDSLKK